MRQAASDMTEHYSMADLGHLFQQVNLITVTIHADAVVTVKRRKMAMDEVSKMATGIKVTQISHSPETKKAYISVSL